ncbi:Tfp pilus assembly protein FimT/FimU [Nitratidesulfovibrio sp. SRB-5]|uniref:pilus assembly FimT family protein n=1 Tax=Nitratidesulfovibrio sp. SRB-5 TaxID=2872636 RepID=UPI00102831C9|nr:type II secretion system protein [Nitratidesulfovibrio sp. SRB-5]MBZ2173510.1 type II secretion system GspH family protein [Nitratidesulfovibrio sp. SRB-5]RXF76650.1 type II secretion system protein [Desulfovibrio sp. DS-1]
MTTHTTQHPATPPQGDHGTYRAADGRHAAQLAALFSPALLPAHYKTGQRGFTIIEVVAVLVIMAVITAVATERFFNQTPMELGGIEASVRSHLRYARTRSMNSDQVFGVQILSTTTYAIFRNGNTGTRVILPGQPATGIITLEDGATFTTGATTFSFDQWGRPCPNATGTLPSSSITISLSYLGQTASIVVVRNTGYLQ